jgi:predicted nuclease of predicted toxin-antitoxin system
VRVLLDNNIDRRFARLLAGQEVTHVQKRGWDSLKNGELIAAADEARYDVLVTADKNLRFQQNLAGRRISFITLNNRFVDLHGTTPLVPQVLAALADLREGSWITLTSEVDPSDDR